MPDIIRFLLFSAVLFIYGYPLFAKKTHTPLNKKPRLLLVLLIFGAWVWELHDLVRLNWQPYLFVGQVILIIVVGYVSIFRVIRILQEDTQERSVPMELYVCLVMLVVLFFQIAF